MPFTTLTDEEEKELYRLSRFYWQEALRCEEAKAYLAGCVMLGSALETLLILMINIYAAEAEQGVAQGFLHAAREARWGDRLLPRINSLHLAQRLSAGLALHLAPLEAKTTVGHQH